MGHGHVTPNPNGLRARCRGPAICSACAREKAAFDAKQSPYRVFHDSRGSWFVFAKRDGDRVSTLYEGESRHKGFRAILEDLGVSVPGILIDDMREDGFEPEVGDWEQDS